MTAVGDDRKRTAEQSAAPVGDVEALRERDARLNAWLEGVRPGDIVTVRLNSTDTLTGKVYEADDPQGRSLCVWTTVLRHGNGHPGGSYEPIDRAEIVEAATRAVWDHFFDGSQSAGRYGQRDWPPPEQHMPWWRGIAEAALSAVATRDAIRDAAHDAAVRADEAERIAREIEAMRWTETARDDLLRIARQSQAESGRTEPCRTTWTTDASPTRRCVTHAVTWVPPEPVCAGPDDPRAERDEWDMSSRTEER